jgi:hypothetical protein
LLIDIFWSLFKFNRRLLAIDIMGGFRLQGPNYRFVSMPSSVKCRCTGYSGNITAEVEVMLLNKHDKWLELSQLPLELRDEMTKHHLGTNMSYDIIHRSKYTRNISDERDAMLHNINYVTASQSELLSNVSQGPSGLDAMFSPLTMFADAFKDVEPFHMHN